MVPSVYTLLINTLSIPQYKGSDGGTVFRKHTKKSNKKGNKVFFSDPIDPTVQK